MNRLLTVPLFGLIALLSTSQAASQSSTNYTTSTGTTGSLLTDKNGNTINFQPNSNLIPNYDANSNSMLQPIGFNFIFMSKRYTHFIVGHDGQIGLGTSTTPATVLPTSANNDLTQVVSYPPLLYNSTPILAAFWDDLKIPVIGSTIRIMITGSAPNRCRTIQWNALINVNSATVTDTADGIFQMRLYESTGEIEYVYGKMTIGPSSSNVTASIGFSAGAADNQFVALQDLTSFNFTTLAVNEPATQNLVNRSTPGPIVGLHSPVEGSRRFIRFTPPALAGDFTGIQIADVGATTMRINWTDNFTNENGFTVYRSTDNINYTAVSDLAPNTNTYLATQLNNNTRYYWKLKTFNEAHYDSSAVATDSTRCTMSGTYSIGSTGQFSTLSKALEAAALRGMTGNVIFELENSYNFSAEIFPLVFAKSIPCRQNAYSITVRPAANVTSVRVVNNSNATMFVLDSTSNITIDGRPGGVGNAKALTLVSEQRVLSINNSSNNIITHVSIRSRVTTSNQGVIVFAGNAGQGSDDNLITDCEIADSTHWNIQRPQTLIYSSASGTIDNRNNKIENCQLFNFQIYAVHLTAGSRGWSIRNNSFYSTEPYSTNTPLAGIISIEDTSATYKHLIEGNYFGGTQPLLGGSPMYVSFDQSFRVLAVNGKFDIRNNHFKNFQFTGPSVIATGSQLQMIGTGPSLYSNSYSASNIINNRIGGPGNAGKISIENYSPFALDVSLLSAGGEIDFITIDSNIIENVQARGYSDGTVGLTGISSSVAIDSARITNNIIRDLSIQNKLYAFPAKYLSGILATANMKLLIKNNEVTRLSSTEYSIGIDTRYATGISGSNVIIEENTISHLISDYSSSGIMSSNSYFGSITKNKIFSLVAKTPTNGVGVTGIHAANSSVAVKISHNLIHSLQFTPGSSLSRSVRGINLEADKSEIHNNMMRLGIDSVGNPINDPVSFSGIVTNTLSDNNIFHNTIYIGGATGGSSCVWAVGAVNITKNIFVNNRKGSGNGLLNFGSYYSRFSDQNVFFRDDTIGAFAYFGNTSQSYYSLDEWRVKTGFDLNSTHANPNFINPDGSSALIDLHVASPTPIEGRPGQSIPSLTDFDHQLRNGLSPIDIGADAGNFVLNDKWRPVLVLDSLKNHHRDSLQVITIKITDDSGTDSSASLKPKMWLRKVAPVYSNWYSVPGSMINGTIKNGSWKFTVDYTSLGLQIYSGDSIECYFVSQDISPDKILAYLPIRNYNHSDVNTQISQPFETLKYKILGLLPDTILVGVGQLYTSLTNTAGAFEYINNASIPSTDIVVVITSDLSETGTHPLRNFNGRSIRIITNTPSIKTISNNGNLSAPLITLTNSKNVHIDGSINNAGRFLRFRNTNQNTAITTACLMIDNNNHNIVLKNSIVESNASNRFIGSPKPAIHLYNDNSNIEIHNNEIKNAMAGGTMLSGIDQSTGKTSGLKVTSNEISNFERSGMQFRYVGDSCLVSDNHLFYNSPERTHSGHNGILINYFVASGEIPTGGHIISGNYIGGSMPFCGGTPWTVTGSYIPAALTKGVQGIFINSSLTRTSYVHNNVIQNINITASENFGFSGIRVFGVVDIGGRGGNIIGSATTANSIVNAGTSSTAGLFTYGIQTNGDINSNVVNNTIANISATGNTQMSIAGIYVRNNDSATAIISKNIIRNLSTTATQSGTMFSVAGIQLEHIRRGIHVFENSISDLRSSGNANNKIAAGIYASGFSRQIKISRNRISSIENLSASNGEVVGIYLGSGNSEIQNNQIALTNGTNTNPVIISGIKDTTTNSLNNPGNPRYHYNSIYVGGNIGTGAANSYAINFQSNVQIQKFRNNLLYNARTGGTGNHIALGVNIPANINQFWSATTSDYNFIVTADTSKATQWTGSGVMSLRGFKQVSNGDASSFLSTVSNVPVDSLFNSASTGNLNINTNSSHAWYVNGKGLPVSSIGGDFDSTDHVRSTSISSGPTDIGSDEFNTSTLPPVLVVYGQAAHGGTDTLFINNRIAATITWGNTGSLPVLGNSRWYSGVWPNDPTNNGNALNARYMSGFWDIPASGGSNYTYSLTLYYDSAMLGKIQNVATMVINKRQAGTPGSWIAIPGSVVNTSLGTITINNQTSFSEFTVTDVNATLQYGSTNPDLIITNHSLNTTSTGTGSTVTATFTEANQGSSVSTTNKVYFYLSADAVLTPGTNGDLLLGEHEVTVPVNVNSNTGPINNSITIPCSVIPGNYNIFFVADGANSITEVSETNNTALSAITIVQEPIVNITVNSSLVCFGSTITLTASGATSYSWSGVGLNQTSGAIVTATPPAPGSYTYKVVGTTNACTDTVMIMINVQTSASCVTALPYIDGLESFSIAPNPSDGFIIVKLKLNTRRKTAFRVFDNIGKEVYRSKKTNMVGSVNQIIDLRHAVAGVYYLETEIEGKKFVEKIVIFK